MRFANVAFWSGLHAEAYYRLQLTPIVQVTPSAMLVMSPSKNPDTDTEGVFSLRAKAQF